MGVVGLVCFSLLGRARGARKRSVSKSWRLEISRRSPNDLGPSEAPEDVEGIGPLSRGLSCSRGGWGTRRAPLQCQALSLAHPLSHFKAPWSQKKGFAFKVEATFAQALMRPRRMGHPRAPLQCRAPSLAHPHQQSSARKLFIAVLPCPARQAKAQDKDRGIAQDIIAQGQA